jgi:hypothetical protein
MREVRGKTGRDIDPECQLNNTALKQQLALIGAPDAISPKKNNTEAHNFGDDTWMRKEKSLNDSRVELDVDVDELNTEYMYPDLGMPWND